MEVKAWTYEEFPEFTEEVEGVQVLPTTGDEVAVQYIHDVVYDEIEGYPVHLQILYPYSRNAGPIVSPAVVYVQGSAWMKQDRFGSLCELAHLARRGYVCALVEYRHSGVAAFPAQAIDACNAIRFLRSHAEEYHILPDKMVVMGNSSGGHTAVWAGLLHNDDTAENHFPGVSAEVNGIIDMYGSVSVMAEDGNPTTVNHHLPDSPEGMVMRADMRANPELRKKLSCETNIFPETEIAPVLIFHGTKDRIVNTRQSVTLYRRLKECGKDATMYLVQGADHGRAEFWKPEVLDIVEEFIQRVNA